MGTRSGMYTVPHVVRGRHKSLDRLRPYNQYDARQQKEQTLAQSGGMHDCRIAYYLRPVNRFRDTGSGMFAESAVPQGRTKWRMVSRLCISAALLWGTSV